ncbi:MAG: malto-oligosyltrehalose trehalohydrolase [Chitinophagales bacterium]|nr:malto-oligosyltrehalose trehalohydrolase [Chitinophagales bacterium]
MRRNIGAVYEAQSENTEFTVWAPLVQQVALVTDKETYPLQKGDMGYWAANIALPPGTKYQYEINGKLRRPDPASRYQPDGVHEWSSVVNHTFAWTDKAWKGIPLEQMIIYELHVGTFSSKGTFEGVIQRLDHFKKLGINAIELMPLAQFPGGRNWGYDGVYPFAVQHTYGGPDGLKQLVDACHAMGIAVLVDVVYNHLGPEGNYLNDFGPYFTDKYHTPWGKSLNFDGPYSDEVRNFFIENAIGWFRDYHIDGLRLDAVHAIVDIGATHFLKELAKEIKSLSFALGREMVLIAESDLNDVRHTATFEENGYGFDGQWADDMHHALHALATGEDSGYYMDYGGIEHLELAYQHGFTYTGQYSKFRNKQYGSEVRHLPAKNFVVCIQNHDQTGNRMLGERLSQLVSFEMLKALAAAYILSPFTPMLFMGEEYAENSPFLYFVSHGDENLIKAVRKGRKEEFKEFKWAGEAPDPQAISTFEQSKLQWDFENDPNKAAMFKFYRQLIKLRQHPVMRDRQRKHLTTDSNEANKLLFVTRKTKGRALWMALNFSNGEVQVEPKISKGRWTLLLDSADKKWQGKGSTAPKQLKKGLTITVSPESVLIYEKD